MENEMDNGREWKRILDVVSEYGITEADLDSGEISLDEKIICYASPREVTDFLCSLPVPHGAQVYEDPIAFENTVVSFRKHVKPIFAITEGDGETQFVVKYYDDGGWGLL